MPSLERFVNPQMRVFSANITSLPGARLYFFESGSSTPKVTYADKQGTTPNTNPVIASSTGTFTPIFLDGLYRVELRSSANIVQPGWPIDNVGQDTPIVPYASWSELVTYAEFERVTDPLTGIVYRSLADNNLGNVPASSPTDWEVVIDPVPSSFTSDATYLSWSDDGGQISLDVDEASLISSLGLATRQSVRVALGGGFDAGQFIVCERIGNTVTISSSGNITHPSATFCVSAASIPSNYRIGSDYSGAVDMVFSLISIIGYLVAINIRQDGTIRISYTDYAGAGVARTSLGSGFSVSYTITSETP